MKEPLQGGFRNRVERDGDRVIRTRQEPASPYVYPTLRLLADHDWPGAPRIIMPGLVEELSYLPGIVPERGNLPDWVSTPESLHELGQLIREFHDLTTGTSMAGDHETVCHNDLAPANTVYDPVSRLPYAFIDWDAAAPGDRIADIGHAAWQWLEFGPKAHISTVAKGIEALLAGYGKPYTVREVLDAAQEWQLQTATGIELGASSDPSLAALVTMRVPDECRAAAKWVSFNSEAIICHAQKTNGDPNRR